MSYDAMRIIDEYLAEVRRYLPEDIRDDVIEELRVNILDKIEDMGGLTIENAYRVINDLGPPRRLASRYVVGRGRKRMGSAVCGHLWTNIYKHNTDDHD